MSQGLRAERRSHSSFLLPPSSLYNASAMGSRDDIITVYLDDQPHRVMRWMEVRHLYTDLPDDLQLAVEQGTAIIQDEHGNRVGSSGALLEGARYYIVDIKGQSSRMNRQDAKDAKM